MSQTRKYQIRCPHCGEEQTAELYDAINIREAPDLKLRLLRNEVNHVVCPGCAYAFRVDKPLLYSDPARQLLIYLIPLQGRNQAEGRREFTESLERLNQILPEGVTAPEVHLVFTRTELVERIFLFDAGLNERLIEYIKYLIYSKNPAKLDPAQKILLFNAEDSTPENLCFVIQDAQTRRLEAMLHSARETYTALAEMFDNDEKTADLLELFPGPYISARTLILEEGGFRDATETPGFPDAPPPPAPPPA